MRHKHDSQINVKESTIRELQSQLKRAEGKSFMIDQQQNTELSAKESVIKDLKMQLSSLMEEHDQERRVFKQELQDVKCQVDEERQTKTQQRAQTSASYMESYLRHEEWLSERRLMMESMNKEREETTLLKQQLQIKRMHVDDLEKQVLIRRSSQESELAAIRTTFEKEMFEKNLISMDLAQEKTSLYRERLRVENVKQMVQMEKSQIARWKEEVETKYNNSTTILHTAGIYLLLELLFDNCLESEREKARMLYAQTEGLKEKLETRMSDVLFYQNHAVFTNMPSCLNKKIL